MLQEEVHEHQLQPNGLRKSTSHSFIKSNHSTICKSSKRGSVNYRSTEESSPPSYFYCGKYCHISNHYRFRNKKGWVWQPKMTNRADNPKSNQKGPKQAWVPKKK